MVWDLEKIYQQGDKTLCSKACPCKAAPSKWTADVGKKMVTGDMGESKITECAAHNFPKQVKSDMNHYKGLMTIIETDFNCAGMCNLSDFYLFTNVNRGIPKHTCKTALSD